MADGIFNIAKGKSVAYFDRVNDNDPSGAELVLVLLKAAEADATLEDYDTLAALLAGANTEADFTNYVRKDITDAGLGPSVVDDTNNRNEASFDDVTWSNAGGATNNNLLKLIVCYDSTGSGADAALVPISHHDFVVTTTGGDLTAQTGSVVVRAA